MTIYKMMNDIFREGVDYGRKHPTDDEPEVPLDAEFRGLIDRHLAANGLKVVVTDRTVN